MTDLKYEDELMRLVGEHAQAYHAQRTLFSTMRRDHPREYVRRMRESRERLERAATAIRAHSASHHRELLKRVVDLCAVGDVDESTEAHGWGQLITDIKNATIPRIN